MRRLGTAPDRQRRARRVGPPEGGGVYRRAARLASYSERPAPEVATVENREPFQALSGIRVAVWFYGLFA